MPDAQLFACPKCSTVTATTTVGKVPNECEACGFDAHEDEGVFSRLGGVSR